MAEMHANTQEEGDAVHELLNCPICHSELEGVSITHCGHRFCTPCILQWLEDNTTCPTCRARVTDGDLIEDRDYDAIVSQLKERRAADEASGSPQQPAGVSEGAITLENISDLLQSILPQRDTDMRDRTDRLLEMYTNETTRQNAAIESQTATITQLNAGVNENAIRLENISDLLQSILPQRDTDMRDRTDRLLEMYTNETTRQNAAIESQTATITQLNGDINRLQSQLDEIPGLRERIVTLQEKVERKRVQKRELSDRLQLVTASDTTSRAIAMQVLTKNTALEEKLLQGAQELQRIKDELENSNTAYEQLEIEKETLSNSVEAHLTKLTEHEANITKLKDLINAMKLHSQTMYADIAKSKREGEILQKDVERLKESGDLCQVRDQEIRYMREQSLPEKDNMIIELQKQIEKCTCELFQFRQNTIPMSNHTAVLAAELSNTIQNLKKYYDDIYRVKQEAMEMSNRTLQIRLLQVETELRSRDDIGDDLTKATKSYKSLVKHNSDLQETVSRQEKDIKRLREDKVRLKEDMKIDQLVDYPERLLCKPEH